MLADPPKITPNQSASQKKDEIQQLFAFSCSSDQTFLGETTAPLLVGCPFVLITQIVLRADLQFHLFLSPNIVRLAFF